MPYYSIPLKAGIEYRHDVAGSLLLIDSVGVSGGVDVALIRNGTPGITMPLRQKAFRYVSKYEGVILKTSVDATVGLFISDSDVQLGVTDGLPIQVPGGVVVNNTVENPVRVLFPGNASVSVPNGVEINSTPGAPVRVAGPVTIDNTPANPVQVQFPNGVISLTASNVSITKAETVTDTAQVAVAGVRGVMRAVNAGRRGLRIKNAGDNSVAIGGVTLDYAKAAVVIQPGEVWNEDEAPGAAWYCVCAAGMTTILNIQELT